MSAFYETLRHRKHNDDWAGKQSNGSSVEEQAHLPEPDYIWGGGGYVASLGRLIAKGNPEERAAAAREGDWLTANEAHVKELMTWLWLNAITVKPEDR
jgi:hypothetical protein